MNDLAEWSPTEYTRHGAVEIAYDRFERGGGTPLLLMTGLALSRTWWPDGLCRAFANEGFDVVRYDQRDSGESTRFGQATRRGRWAALLGTDHVPYTSEDVVDDAAAVLDAVGWERAVVFGHSLGGIVAQRFALRHPRRALAVVSCDAPPSDAAGFRALRYLRLGLLARLAAQSFPDGHDGDVAASLAVARKMASPVNPCDEEEARARIERGLGSGPRDVSGLGRQLHARWRGPRLRELDAPALVLHGEDDPLIRTSAARDTARAIRGARRTILSGVGHDLPTVAWKTLAEQTRQLVEGADVGRVSA
ncbi:alpha/beta fold hydrolase [Promicromonospora sp. Populi]|uniref:alpha/beta fold hydrolase n=1 Tax=Promicromonospora sp. Populi TaxID=3239420 RepID=UPI0034E2E700